MTHRKNAHNSLAALLFAASALAAGCGSDGGTIIDVDGSLPDGAVGDGSRDGATPTDAAMDARMDATTDGDMATDAPVDMGTGMPGIVVTPTSGLMTTEAGGTDTFTVVLAAAPTGDVTIGLSTSSDLEATVEPAELTFTPDTWDAPQTVTVTGVDDPDADGDQEFIVELAPATSTDINYAGLNGDDVTGTNHDDETPGILVDAASGLTLSESGATVTFTVALQSRPTTSVSVAIASSDETEATVSTDSAVFSALNWNIPQVITVSSVDDFVADGDQTVQITIGPAGGDTAYVGLTATPVSVTNEDDDSASVTVAPTSIATTENGGTADFTVVLDSMPTASVTFAITSSDDTEGTVSPATLTFTTVDWNVPQLVTVTGVDDAIADGSVPYTVTVHVSTSADSAFAAVADQDVNVTNSDDELPGITVTPTSGIATNESGGTASVTIVLNSQPTSTVTIDLSSDTTSEGNVAVASVSFTTLNWDMAQTIVIEGVNDDLDDGDREYHIVTSDATSADPNYSGLSVPDITVTNEDDDTAGFSVSPSAAGTTSEGGSAAVFGFALTSQPTATVTLTLTSADATEGTVSPATLTFTTVNWNTPQSVTVTPVDDSTADGDITYSIFTSAAASSDMSYSGMAVPDLSVTNTDNDVASVIVTPTSGLSTSESGTSTTFTIVLSSQPTANVTIALSSSDTSEGLATPSSVVFSSSNWNSAQVVTVIGVDDLIVDGSVGYTIVTGAATSSDASYSGLAVADVSVTNSDNDVAGVIVTPTSLGTTETGGTGTFTIVLTAEPVSPVTINLSSSDATEGSVSPSSVTFTTANWSVPQSCTVTGADDALADGDIAYTIVTSATVSSDAAYNGIVVSDVSATNTDNDTAGVIVTPTSGLVTTEAGGTATFTMVLTAAPSSNVTIALSSSNTSEGTVSPSTATFTTSNWSTPLTVTVTGVDDSAIDANVAFTVVTGASASADPAFNGLTVSDVSVTNNYRTSYIKASNTAANDVFGGEVAISGDGNTLAVAATGEDSNATGIGGDQTNNTSTNSGAVYVFVRSAGTWIQQAYIKASNTDAADLFGYALSLSNDGNTLAVSALSEDSNATGVGGTQTDNSSASAGGAYVFSRSGTTWSQQAYIKASNTGAGDSFGTSVALASDGNTLVVGAPSEASNGTGLSANQADNSNASAGAAYIFVRAGTVWTQQAYAKASNTGTGDRFGATATLSSDGNTLAVGATGEASNASSINGDQANNAMAGSGAVYVFTRSGVTWTQEAYLKAFNTDSGDAFGTSLDIAANGNTLAVGAYSEDSNATTINGDQTNNGAANSGAAYVFVRSAGVWTQEAYIKAPNTNANDYFGSRVRLSSTGNTVAVSAYNEASTATSLNGDQSNNAAASAGAVYLFTRSGVTWTHASYLKASNTGANDLFGSSLDLADSGGVVAIGASGEASNATGIGGDQTNNASANAGAAYVF